MAGRFGGILGDITLLGRWSRTVRNEMAEIVSMRHIPGTPAGHYHLTYILEDGDTGKGFGAQHAMCREGQQ